MAPVKFGVVVPQDDFQTALRSARLAEELGFHSVSINDHFVSQVGSPANPQLESMTTLTAIAASTERIRLVPSVLSASFRQPALLAKMIATLDQVSGGRFTLGIGAGWHVAEYEAHGYSFPSARERIERLGETLEILKAMWTQDDPTFAGKYLSVEHASSQPRTVQQPHVPIMVGGAGESVLRIAAQHADIVNLIPPTSAGKDFLKDSSSAVAFTEEVLTNKVSLLRSLAADIGRDPAEIEIGGLAMLHVVADGTDSSQERLAARIGFGSARDARRAPVALIGTSATVTEELQRRVAETGVSYFILVPTSTQTIRRFAEEVMPAFA